MNDETNHQPSNEAPAAEGKKKPFAVRGDMAKGLRVRTALRAGAINGDTQPQRRGTWVAGIP